MYPLTPSLGPTQTLQFTNIITLARSTFFMPVAEEKQMLGDELGKVGREVYREL